MKETAYISGHLDLTPEEWNEHYHLRVLKAALAGHCFVVGDAKGSDYLAQLSLSLKHELVTVYHMLGSPRNLVSERFTTKGGFKSDNERDAAMTLASTYDIAWVRPGREKSGTAKNLKRRGLYKTCSEIMKSGEGED